MLAGLSAQVRHELRLLAVATEFLTRLPVPTRRRPGAPFHPDWLNSAVRYFPLVGGLVGLIGATVWTLALLWWPPLIAAVLAVAATALVTGAFHEDGLADTLDGLGGAVTRERALEIMKDSRVGTYGALGLVLVTAVRVLALASLAVVPGPGAVPESGSAALAGALTVAWPGVVGLLSAHVLGRLGAVVVMATCRYAGDPAHAKAKPLATSVTGGTLTVALGLAGVVVVPLAVTAPGGVVLAVAVTAGVSALMVRWLRRRLGGYTGDTLGATEQCVEAAVLLTWAAR